MRQELDLTPTLIDSGFLFALLYAHDRLHTRCRSVFMRGQFTSLIPEIVLAETAYLFRRETAAGDLAFLKALQIFKPELVSLSYIDLERALEIRVHYQHFNFVDCCIMAQAERLNITHICTLDMRDFSQFRPRHIPFFVLLPAMLPE